MKTNLVKSALWTIIICALSWPSLKAATSLEDFSGWAPDARLTAALESGEPSPWSVTYLLNSNTRQAIIWEDVDNMFGQGTDNKYLFFYGGSTTNNLVAFRSFEDGASDIGQMDLVFYDPGVSVGTSNNFGLTMRLYTTEGSPSNAATAFGLILYDGEIYAYGGKTPIASYDLNTAVTLSLIFNNSDHAVEYDCDGDSVVLSAQTCDILVNSQRVAVLNQYGNGTTNSEIKSLSLQALYSESGFTEMYIDSIQLSSSINIPEPAAGVVGALCLVFLLVMRRRR